MQNVRVVRAPGTNGTGRTGRSGRTVRTVVGAATSLVDDSDFIVLGTLKRPPSTAPGASYLIDIARIIGGGSPPINIFVSPAEVHAAKLITRKTYVFFWGAEGSPLKGGACIIGGRRGVMAYNAASQTVTRLDHNSQSTIPRTQTLRQLSAEVQQAAAATARAPIEVAQAPVCAPSATGLPS